MQSDEDTLNCTKAISTMIKEETDFIDDICYDKKLELKETESLVEINMKKDTKIRFECAHCDKKIVKSKFYVKHVQEEHGGKSFICCFCSAQFGSGEQENMEETR